MIPKILISCFCVMLLLSLSLLNGCGEMLVPMPINMNYSKLSETEIAYVERFNVTAKNIRDFPPKKDHLEKYFHIYSNVPDFRTAKFLLFGEQHVNSASQLWTSGAINEIVDYGDVILFEGAQSKIPVYNVTELIVADIFAAREFELRKTEGKYKPISISKIRDKFQALFNKTKDDYLVLDILKFNKARGYFWDLKEGKELHKNKAKRNESMVKTHGAIMQTVARYADLSFA